MRPSPRTGGRTGYSTEIAGLWSGLSTTLGRLEALAGEPVESLDGGVLETVVRLQYALHAASELAVGMDPPEGSRLAHAELAEALADARDATADVVEAVESGGPVAAAALVHEWRGALFRVRLASLRVRARRPAPPAPSPPPRGRDARRSSALAGLAFGVFAAVAFAAAAVLDLWPL